MPKTSDLRAGPLLGLCLLQAAVTLSFQAYDLFQPVLLERFGFSALAAGLAAGRGVLAAVLAPAGGALADREVRGGGVRLPILYLGLLCAGLIFVTVGIGAGPAAAWLPRTAVPVLVLLWIAAMALFQGPALSLLKQAAVPRALPRAAALLTVSGGLVGALGPFLLRAMAGLGAALTFTLGGLMLGALVLALRALVAPAAPPPGEAAPEGEPLGVLPVVIAGLLAGALLGLAARAHGVAWRAAWPLFDGRLAPASAALCATLLALPAARLVERIGVQAGLAAGLAVLGLLGLGLPRLPPSVWLAVAATVAAGAAQALVGSSGVPMAIGRAGRGRTGLFVGLFIGAMAAAPLLLGWVGRLVR